MSKRICKADGCKTDISHRNYQAKYCLPCGEIRRNNSSKRNVKLHKRPWRDDFEGVIEKPAPKPLNQACKYMTGFTSGEVTVCGKSVNGVNYCVEHDFKTRPIGGSNGFHKSCINGKAPSGRSL